MYPRPVQNLIDLFSKFPTVGPRTAARFVFYLQRLQEEKIEELTKAIQQFKEKMEPCSFCFNPFEKEGDQKLCPICANPKRNTAILCIVEKETDLEALEKIKKYNGLYLILGGTTGKLRKKDLEALRMKELKDRIINPERFGLERTKFQEIIIATNPTAEGEATALYLQRELSSIKVKMTRLGRGLPVGGELEYADEETIAGALEGRK